MSIFEIREYMDEKGEILNGEVVNVENEMRQMIARVEEMNQVMNKNQTEEARKRDVETNQKPSNANINRESSRGDDTDDEDSEVSKVSKSLDNTSSTESTESHDKKPSIDVEKLKKMAEEYLNPIAEPVDDELRFVRELAEISDQQPTTDTTDLSWIERLEKLDIENSGRSKVTEKSSEKKVEELPSSDSKMDNKKERAVSFDPNTKPDKQKSGWKKGFLSASSLKPAKKLSKPPETKVLEKESTHSSSSSSAVRDVQTSEKQPDDPNEKRTDISEEDWWGEEDHCTVIQKASSGREEPSIKRTIPEKQIEKSTAPARAKAFTGSIIEKFP